MPAKTYVYNGTVWEEITSSSSIQAASVGLAGIVQLTDSTTSTSTTTAATPNSVFQATKNLQYNMYASASRVGNFPHYFMTGNNTQTSGAILHTRHLPERDFTVSNISFITGGAAFSALTLCRFGIYTRSGSTFTLVARTASDTTIGASQSTRYTRALNTTGGYPATYNFVAGNEYWVSFIAVGTNMGNLIGYGTTTTTAQENAFGAFSSRQTSQTDLVTSSTGTTQNLITYSEVS